MKREGRMKSLNCAGCHKPTPCGAEAVRVMCAVCTIAGKRLPQDEQLDMLFVVDGGKSKPKGEAIAQ
jgi:hypothetical protein